MTVRLKVNDTGELSEDDVALAGEISAAAGELGVSVDLAGLQTFQIAIDALVIPDVMPFWAAVLGYVQVADILVDFEGPTFCFQQMDLRAHSATASTSISTSRKIRREPGSMPPWRRAAESSTTGTHRSGGRSPIPRRMMWTLLRGRTRPRESGA